MKDFIRILILGFVTVTFFSCSKPDTNNGQNRSDEKNIITFKVLEENAIVSNSTNKIELTLPAGTNLTNLTPEIVLSSKATVYPTSGTSQDFTSPVTYTVTAENETTKNYSVVISTLKSNEKAIVSFVINNKTATINETLKTIDLELPSGTNISSLSPTIIVSNKASISPQSNVITNFTSPVIYSVTAENGTTVNYTAKITVQKSSEKNLISFDLIKANLSNSVYTKTPDTVLGYINQNTKEIIFTSQENANIQNVTPLIKLPNNATITPNSMVGQDFNIPLSYTVKAEDGTTNQYTVKFEKKKFAYSSSAFLNLKPYIRPNKTTVTPGEEIMVELTGAGYYALVTRGIGWARAITGGNTVSASLITKVNSDGTKFYFKFSEKGVYKIWLLLEDFLDGATRQVKSNEYSITVQ